MRFNFAEIEVLRMRLAISFLLILVWNATGGCFGFKCFMVLVVCFHLLLLRFYTLLNSFKNFLTI